MSQILMEADQGALDNAVTTGVTNSLQEGIRNLQLDQSGAPLNNSSSLTISEMIERDNSNQNS